MRVLLGFARCVFIGSTVLEVIFYSFCEAILVLIIPKHRSHAFFFRGNLDIIASNQLLCVPTGSYCRRSSKASIINPAKEIFDYVHANMIKFEKCDLKNLTVFIRTSMKSHLICLFVVLA